MRKFWTNVASVGALFLLGWLINYALPYLNKPYGYSKWRNHEVFKVVHAFALNAAPGPKEWSLQFKDWAAANTKVLAADPDGVKDLSSGNLIEARGSFSKDPQIVAHNLDVYTCLQWLVFLADHSDSSSPGRSGLSLRELSTSSGGVSRKMTVNPGRGFGQDGYMAHHVNKEMEALCIIVVDKDADESGLFNLTMKLR